MDANERIRAIESSRVELKALLKVSETLLKVSETAAGFSRSPGAAFETTGVAEAMPPEGFGTGASDREASEGSSFAGPHHNTLFRADKPRRSPMTGGGEARDDSLMKKRLRNKHMAGVSGGVRAIRALRALQKSYSLCR